MTKLNKKEIINSLLVFFGSTKEEILYQHPEFTDNQIISFLLGKLKKHKKESDLLDKELEDIQDVLYSFIKRDFSTKLKISDAHTDLDALKLSINYQGEELKTAFEELELQNKKLNQFNEEKAVLLKEIHHRVKNNLQVITSLLSLQSSFINNKEVKDVLRYSQFRINSMAMVHDLLYKSEDLNKINFNDYVSLLANMLIKSYKRIDCDIHLELCCDPLKLNIDTAIPLGLIINEIITNSLKYGFKGRDSGKIYIGIKILEQPNFELFIGDDGIGYNDSTNHKNSNSLGLKLIHNLSLQLMGSVKKDPSLKGTNYIIPFKEIDHSS